MHQRRVHVGIVVGYDVALHLRQGAGNLHTGGATAHDHHVEQFLSLLLGGAGERALQVGEQGVAQAHGLGHGLHGHGPLFDVLVAKEVGCGSGRQNQVVVVDLADGGL